MPSSGLAKQHPELPQLIQRYANGESVQELAQEINVHRATLYRWMLAGSGDAQYEQLVTHCLTRRVADADAQLETAQEACDIARAREIAKFARMDLERRRPHLYGQKQQVTIDQRVTVDVAMSDELASALQEIKQAQALPPPIDAVAQQID